MQRHIVPGQPGALVPPGRQLQFWGLLRCRRRQRDHRHRGLRLSKRLGKAHVRLRGLAVHLSGVPRRGVRPHRAWPRPPVARLSSRRQQVLLLPHPYLRSNATAGASSHLFVGASASLSGDSPVMSMSFVQGPKEGTFYYVPLVGISVGQTRLPIPPAVFALKPNGSGGGVIVDSGTPTTGLAHGAYGPLREELRRQLNGSLVPSPADSEMDLCVAVTQEKKVPSMVLHFSGGADMVLPPENYWVPLDSSTSCMVMERSDDMSVIGNFQLQNIHLLYDLAKDELSFQTADCSKL
uniref:Peptidase A1 domain-containing protein n=1 Tax=Triticum urartu TaxID=4572 RepID=A0A8R7Q1M1_TRIUA